MRTGRILTPALALLLAAPRVRPCAPAPREGQRVDILAEEALIVWDADRKLEHFVRRASFRSGAADFGFLVPTPSRPELAAASDAVFTALEELRRPEVIRREHTTVVPTLLVLWPFLLLRTGAPGPIGAGVQVLEERRVAGYDAAVLAADDVRALSAWLAAHGYAQRPELLEWLRPYVAARFVVTAFKIAGAEQGRVATSAVRMSFASERPFFPYREPEEQRRAEAPAARRLLVHLVAPQRLAGQLGDGRPWNGSVLYASPRADLGRLLAGAMPENGPSSGWLTSALDSSSPRPGTDDLYFAPAALQDRVKPDPVVELEEREIPLPLDLLAALLGGVLWLRRRARVRAARSG